MLDPRVWSKPFVGVLMAAVPWEALRNYVGQKEIERLENILTLLCLAAVGRWMYVERFGDEATKIKYWHRAFWVVAVTLLLSAVSGLFVRGLGMVDIIYGLISCVPFAVALLYRQKMRDDGHEKQGADQQEDRKTDDKAKEIGEREYRRIDDTSKETVFSPIIEIRDEHPVLNEVQPSGDATGQFMTIASKLHTYVDHEKLKTMNGLSGEPTVGRSGRPAIVDDSVWFEKDLRNRRDTFL